MTKQWLTPFKRQCFVCLGVCLSMAGHGLTMGFTAVLLPALRRPGARVAVDDASGSWVGQYTDGGPEWRSMAGHGLTTGFTAVLLPALRRPGARVAVDDASGSWVGQYTDGGPEWRSMAGHGLTTGFTAVLLPALRRPGARVAVDDASGSWVGQYTDGGPEWRSMAGHGLTTDFTAVLLPALRRPGARVAVDDASGSWVGQYTEGGPEWRCMAGHGLTTGFTAVLLPALRWPEARVAVADASGSWVGQYTEASILGFALVAGNFIVPALMAKCGRRAAHLVNTLPMLAGWFCVLAADSVPALLVARFLQGISMGMIATLGPVLIGEYTSPKNRGSFLMTLSLAIAIGVLTVHAVGSYFGWQMAALVCAFISFTNLLIVIYSPESPAWLADQGRYEESKEVFRWLRGNNEEEELRMMIETSEIVRESKKDADITDTFFKKLKKNVVYINETVRKREFYKPIFIMMHIYTLGQWGGANFMSAYTTEILGSVIGPGASFGLIIVSLGVQRIISNSSAVYVIKKLKRKTILLITILINICAYLSIAAYTYAKKYQYLPFDHPFIGVILVHIHMFSIATGTVPLPLIIAGELFPLEYRSLAGGVSVLFVSISLFVTVKTLPFFFATFGLHGSYCIYAGVVAYCLLVTWLLLPETKDRTLRDIEDEFRGRPLSPEELKSTQSLASWRLYNTDRRCSHPVV